MRVLNFIYSVLVIGCITLIGWTGFFAPQAAYAVPTQDTVIGPDSQGYATREEAYEKAVQAVNDPKGLDKEFKKDVEIFKEENPDQKELVKGAESLIDEAKEVVEKVTGKD